ncbi:MAG TPA: trigger factor [Bacillota bacterium]|nr:trigger factor [Bacillota bacterium]
MKANAERIEKNTVLLEIEIDAEQFSQAVEKAYRKLVKNVNVPGFRKGKTPRPILERYIGKGALLEEAMDFLVPESYLQAVKDTGIEPVDKPKFEVVQAEEGKPVVFKATVQVKPEVKLGRYKGLEVTKPSTEVTDEDVDGELEKLRNRHAKLVSLENGKVEKGDIAVIDFLGKIDGVPFKGGEARDFSLEIGSGSFVEGFEDQVAGMSVGETGEVKVTFPGDYKEDLAGKEAVFTVTVKEIKRKEIAPLDDEFARDVSEFDTLEELRNDISNKLKQAAETRAKLQVRRELVNTAAENAEVEIPDVMIDNSINEGIYNMETRLAAQGISMSDYLKFTGGTMEELRASMRPEALLRVKTSLVMEAIAKAENITATEEEINKEIEKIAAHYNQDPGEFRKKVEQEGELVYISEGIVREKTTQFLVDNAVFTGGTNEEASE